MSTFDQAIEYVLHNEGVLSENPNDRGGITVFGISLRFLKSLSPIELKNYGIHDAVTEQTIRDLTEQQAKDILYGEFWQHARFSEIKNQEQCNYIFDMAVNSGIAQAIKCAQRACWACMKRRALVDDGILGDKTLMTINMCGFLLMPALRSERAGYYRLITQSNPENHVFLQGWLKRAYEGKY